jgi:hypothetical protein
LIVRNTQENLDLIDSLVEADTTTGPAQSRSNRSSSKSRKTTSRSSASIGCWAVSILPSKDGIFAGRRNLRNISERSINSIFPFPIQNGPYTDYPVTAATASGGLAISQNAIDSLLFGTAGAVGAFAGHCRHRRDHDRSEFQLVIVR